MPTATDGFPVLRLTAVRSSKVDLSERKIGAWSRSEAESYLVKRWDFLVARGNGSLTLVGRGGLVEVEPDSVAYPDTLIRARLSSAFMPRLFAQVWNSALVRKQIETMARTTAGIYKVNQTDLSRVYVALAPESEQSRVLEALEGTASVVDAIERTAESSLARCQRLHQTILKWAFDGKLIDQDPTDEPASVFLDRIKVGRQKTQAEGDASHDGDRKRKMA